MHKTERQQLAEETHLVYAPLANRLGIGHLKWQLEDLSFRYLEPDTYKSLSKSLKSSRVEREKFVDSFVKDLYQLLDDAGLKNTEVTGRAKHIYSIHKKMQRKKVGIEEIYDAIAVRILVATVEDCYTTLGHINAKWDKVNKEFDDYVAQPKPNGYRSIHTAIVGPGGRHVEIQIRTHEMHEESELGVAAHWKYKEEGSAQADYENKIAWLRQVMDWQKEVSEHDQQARELSQLFDDRVYVFTPGGDVMDLPKGSTPLDFAYHIHSEVGHRCRGGKVNDKLVPLTYQLQTGEKVSILTSKQAQPSRDWLNASLGYLKTTRAKSKVHSWFRAQEYDLNLHQGQELAAKELRRLNLKMADLNQVVEKLNFHALDDLLAALGRGDVRMASIVNALQEHLVDKTGMSVVEEVNAEPVLRESQEKEFDSDVVIHGVGKLLTHVAHCCKPVPGDSIVGYLTVNRGVSIHRSDCVNLLRLQEHASARLIEVEWGDKSTNKYPVDVEVNAYDRQGLLRDITSLLANEKVNMIGIQNALVDDEQVARIKFTIEIDSLSPLSRIFARIEQLPNVLEVKRL